MTSGGKWNYHRDEVNNAADEFKHGSYYSIKKLNNFWRSLALRP